MPLENRAIIKLRERDRRAERDKRQRCTYLGLFKVYIWTVCNSRRLLTQLCLVHSSQRGDGEGVQVLWIKADQA